MRAVPEFYHSLKQLKISTSNTQTILIFEQGLYVVQEQFDSPLKYVFTKCKQCLCQRGTLQI